MYFMGINAKNREYMIEMSAIPSVEERYLLEIS